MKEEQKLYEYEANMKINGDDRKVEKEFGKCGVGRPVLSISVI